MATKSVKDEYIKVRVSSEDKEKLKKIAKEKNMSMSEILFVATKREIEIYEEKHKYYNKICDRAVATDEKLQEIKIKLEKRKSKKRGRFKFLK